jgi:phenylalanyl-tRNA synthetase alpha chain
MIGYKQITTTSFVLTAEGSMIVENGSHEYRVWEVLPAQGGVAMGIPDLKVRPAARQSLAVRQIMAFGALAF